NELAQTTKPSIAAIDGACFGGGLELALACDFRIATSGSEMGLTEVRLGIMPGAGGTVRLPRLIGLAKAKELILTGRRISTETAFEMGLLDRVVPKSEISSAAQSLASEIAECAPLSVAMAKRALEGSFGLSFEDGLALERECYEKTLVSEDRQEGLKAFA